jgi:putative ABC transport system permease protein
VRPALGREFESGELRPGSPGALVLTDGLWRRSFGADRSVVGRSVTLDDALYTIVGVLPPDFWFPQPADAFVPLRSGANLSNTGTNTTALARLRPGSTLAQAQAEMPAVFESYWRSPEANRAERGMSLATWHDAIVGDVQLNLRLAFGAVLLLLVIACANLASLLTARNAARRREVAVRQALGCSRRRLLGQFVTENLLLSLAGGAAGILLADRLLPLLVAVVPFGLPSSSPIRIDAVVLAFTFATALGTGLVFSLAPLAGSARTDVHAALKSGGRSIGGSRVVERTRALLMIGQVALSVALLVGAGLLIQTLYRLHREDLGFEPEGLITFDTPVDSYRVRTADQLRDSTRELLERLRALPGVQSVAATSLLPLRGQNNLPAQRDGHPEQSIGGTEYRRVTPQYFETMGIAVRRGRALTERDARSSPPVVVINETLARAWWPGAEPLGDRLVIGRYQGREYARDVPREIVGVVADAKDVGLKTRPRPTVYVTIDQAADRAGTLTWVVRAGRGAGPLEQELRRAVAAFDSAQRVLRLRPMAASVSAVTAESRFNAWLLGVFAALALAVTAIGIYGMLAFWVAQRRQEIGTRMALGAGRADILQLVMRQGFAILGAGLLIGLGAAFALARTLSTLLYGVRPNDALNYAAVSLVLLAVGLLSAYFPARRATRVDPMVALRYE